jgi:DnaJ-class molecular chaperone
MKNYHIVLGVNINATIDDINQAYRRLVLKYHPDKNLENQQECLSKFKEIQEAYEYLINQKSKSYFDFSSKNSVDDVFDNIFYRVLIYYYLFK